MGVISDAIDALEDWCCDLFKDGIKSQFDGISDLLTDTFAQTTGSGAKGKPCIKLSYKASCSVYGNCRKCADRLRDLGNYRNAL